eukprot:5939333-Amphidinium_carterae.1
MSATGSDAHEVDMSRAGACQVQPLLVGIHDALMRLLREHYVPWLTVEHNASLAATIRMT